jgi:hypothetical protein
MKLGGDLSALLLDNGLGEEWSRSGMQPIFQVAG